MLMGWLDVTFMHTVDVNCVWMQINQYLSGPGGPHVNGQIMSVDGFDWHSSRPINKYAAKVEYDGKNKEYGVMAPPKRNAAESRIWVFHEFTRRDQ